jgi:hypothetical protein
VTSCPESAGYPAFLLPFVTINSNNQQSATPNHGPTITIDNQSAGGEIFPYKTINNQQSM